MKNKITFLFSLLIFVGIVFKANGQVDNTFIGEDAGLNNTGNFNTGYGKYSLKNNSSNSNNAFGLGTLVNSSGGFNCAFGNEALALNGAGKLNCAFGTRCLVNNVSGVGNIAIGHRTLEANVLGSNNTAIGYSSLLSTIGNSNTALGSYSPRNLLSGDSNIFIGAETAINLLNGSFNVFLGNRIALQKLPSTPILAGNDTNKSIIIADGLGNQRIFVNKDGNTGIGLGNNVIPVNKLDIRGGVAIGRSFTPNVVTPGIVAPSNGLLVEGKVGIGTASPNNKVEIKQGTNGNSGLRFTNLTSSYIPPLTQKTNKFLTVNQNGDVVMQNVEDPIKTNLLTSNANTMTSSVNGVSSSAPIVNSIFNTINSQNQLITTVNGVASAPVNIPQTDISELDDSVTNEIQTLSQSGNVITLSQGGGSFTLPTFTDTDQQNLALEGNTLSISNGNSVVLPPDVPQILTQTGNTVTLSQGRGSFDLPTFTDTDAQTLVLAGNTLTISNGNSVVLPPEVPQILTQTGNTVTLSNGGGSFNLPTFTDTDAQTLALAGNTLTISNGNSVVLPPDVPQILTQTGNTVTLSNGGGSFNLPTFTDTDAQTLALSGNTLSISNGNSVVLPPQILIQTGNTVTLSNGGGSFNLPTFTDTDAQTLALAGNTLTISNGNSVVLPPQIPQILTQTGNTVTLSNGGGSFNLPTFTDTDAQTLALSGNTLSISNGNSVVLPPHVPQVLTQTGNTITLSQGGGSFNLPTTTVTAGTNVTVTGTGAPATPYVISANDTSIYANNGTIDSATTTSSNRVVTMNNNNIWFKSAATDTNGKIYIGTNANYPITTGNYKLLVEGGILTEKVKVALRSTANWADNVFEKNYNLMPLKSVEEYIATHKHLPGIDAAGELTKNGLDLAEMQAKQMAKIEELMLYIIEQNKIIEKNNKDIEELKKQVKVLTTNKN